MAKVTAIEITAMGFTPEMFRKSSDADLTTLVNGAISTQSSLLRERVGASVYDASTSAVLKRAEACLVAAELVRTRINIILGNIVGAGQEINTRVEREQLKQYMDEAAALIARTVAGGATDSSDLAFGVLTTSHFEVADA
ncbi:MAG: hypothetical protein WC291_08305 [Thermodesulfovibrionales bacterium]|jgi:hypothetical protein